MPKFIILEGNDGVGKTTQCEKLSFYFNTKRQESSVILSESGSTALGERLFEMIRWPDKSFHINSTAVAFMIAAARFQLVENQIIPHLENNTNVICDRFSPSGIVYGTIDCKLPMDLAISILPESFLPTPQPDHIIILDAPVDIVLKRLASVPSKRDFFESRTELFEERRNLYLALAKKYQWPVIDTTQRQSKVHQDIIRILEY